MAFITSGLSFYSEHSMELAPTEEDTEATTKEEEETPDDVTVDTLSVANQLPMWCFTAPTTREEETPDLKIEITSSDTVTVDTFVTMDTTSTAASQLPVWSFVAPTTKEEETPDLEIKRTNSDATVDTLSVHSQLPVWCFLEKWKKTEPADAFGKAIGTAISSAFAKTTTTIPSTAPAFPPPAFPSADDSTVVTESEYVAPKSLKLLNNSRTEALLC
jgi:hypothetical protein